MDVRYRETSVPRGPPPRAAGEQGPPRVLRLGTGHPRIDDRPRALTPTCARTSGSDVDEMRSIDQHFAASRATVVMPGLAEGRLLTGMTMPDDIAKSTWTRCAGGGAQVRCRGRPRPGPPTGKPPGPACSSSAPIDTVGAGDGFAAGYLAAFPRRRQPAGAS